MLCTNKSYTHLTIEERKQIESFLNIPNITLNQIASSLNRSPKCIRYEIKKHRFVKVRSNQRNKCGLQVNCSIQRLCTHCIAGFCSQCTHDNCNQLCENFTREPVCIRTTRFPFTCSNCSSIERCKLPKFFYLAQLAHDGAIRNNTVWKEGPKLSELELKNITKIIKEGVKNKQSLDVIINTNNLPVSVSTIYRYIEKRYIDGIQNIDLKRKVRYKARNSVKSQPIPLNYDYLNGRRYAKFIERIEDGDSSINIWEMDTIVGKIGGDEKAVLSLLHRKSNLQFYFLLPRLNSLEVNKVFSQLKEKLGSDLFKETFTIILTDNGHEFRDPLSLETDLDTGEILISIYYCEPRRSEEKGKCEKNHEHFRECIPKGISMNSLSIKDIEFVSLMVNNYPRRLFNFNSPYQIAKMFLNKKVLEINRLTYIANKEVVLTPIIHK
ncbi:IS30 family transposase [Breznakia sp. PF5-3]|uniref:IS30 family transposase n=1 Tax=unclassified Breznakia TaxID=2623764 RepID=UPI0024074995|nr:MULTISPECIES: IS30 family transposase [unclassified Breznakia]MDF9825908.1 IS30 family transposase [Breznakia sp. PM6-1]MDF9836704.1 IS30 family transposase [Breznakia sp. PF5-3]